MLSVDKKIEFYNILNGIKKPYLKSDKPFDVINSDIKLTYNKIDLCYIKGKNYFVKVKKSSFKERGKDKDRGRSQERDGQKKHRWDKSKDRGRNRERDGQKKHRWDRGHSWGHNNKWSRNKYKGGACNLSDSGVSEDELESLNSYYSQKKGGCKTNIMVYC